MEKLIILVVTFCAFSAKSQTSVYHPFPDSGAVWNFQRYYCFGGDESYSITILGDTVLKNRIYHKLSTPYVNVISSSSPCTPKRTGYLGAIREDTLAKQVYYFSPTDSSEQLLYNFNLQRGDTVRGFITRLSTLHEDNIVQSIDSILIGDTYRKRWNIVTCWYRPYRYSIIEGIGSTHGLFEHNPGCIADLPYYILTCYSEAGMSLYPSISSNCQLITSLDILPTSQQNITVFPNPSNGSFSVRGEKSIGKVHLVDMLGQTILHTELKNESEIYINNIDAGVYFLTITDKNKLSKCIRIVSCP